MPEAENQRVIIVPPRFWSQFFLTIGFYDLFRDLIVIKGGLPEVTFRQTLAHEQAHREWSLDHPMKTKIYNFFFWKPGIYFIFSAVLVFFYFISVGLFWPNFVVLSSIAFFFYLSYPLLHEILESTAKKPAIVGLGSREILRIALVPATPYFFVLPVIPALHLISFRGSFAVLGLCLLAILLYQVQKMRVYAKAGRKGTI